MGENVKACIVLLAPSMLLAVFLPSLRVGILGAGILVLLVVWQETSAMQRRIERLESDEKKAVRKSLGLDDE